jgi:transposase
VVRVRCVVEPLHDEVKSFGTTTAALLELEEWLTSHGVSHVAMEATGVYWKPVWHLLEEHFELVPANAQHIRNVPGRKTDVNDATWIADVLAHGLIRSSFVPPAPIQELRDLTRTRKQLVREISQHSSRIQKILEDANLKLASRMLQKAAHHAWHGSDWSRADARTGCTALLRQSGIPARVTERAQSRRSDQRPEAPRPELG